MEAGFLTESLIVVSEYLNLFQPEHSLLGDTTSENRARYVAMQLSLVGFILVLFVEDAGYEIYAL